MAWVRQGGVSMAAAYSALFQFLYGRGRRELSVKDVQTTHVGLKDQRKGLFSVWQEVFQLPRAQR